MSEQGEEQVAEWLEARLEDKAQEIVGNVVNHFQTRIETLEAAVEILQTNALYLQQIITDQERRIGVLVATEYKRQGGGSVRSVDRSVSNVQPMTDPYEEAARIQAAQAPTKAIPVQ